MKGVKRALWAFLALGLCFPQGGWVSAQQTPPKTKEEYLKTYVQSLSPEEAARWVKSQGANFIYIGTDELFPGLGPLLKGRSLKVYVGEGTQGVPWLDRAGVRYTLVQFPGKLSSEEGVLVALDGYVLGVDREKKGRYSLVKHKDVANILYRMFTVYEAFAKVVVKP